jgi:hypothetical protein
MLQAQDHDAMANIFEANRLNNNSFCQQLLLIFICCFKGQMAWYVVYRGREPGVYATWATCHAQVNGFPSSCYKRFRTKEEAVASLLEFKGCQDEQVLVHPPSKGVRKTPVLFVVAMVQSFVLLVLMWFVLTRCYKCL